MSVIYPTYASAGNLQNGYPMSMVYFAPPQQPFQSQAPQVYNPATVPLAMPPFVPEQQPVFYTLDGCGNYVMLASPQCAPVVPTGPNNVNGEYHPMHLSTTYSDGSVDSVPPHDLTPGFYDAYLNTSSASRKSFGSGDKMRTSPGMNNAYKTLMCNMFSTNGSCTYGAACQYAHGSEEIRPIVPHPKYKTMLCNKFNSPGGCQYGDKCHFRHPDDSQPGNATPPKTSQQRKPSNGSGKKKKNGRKPGKPTVAAVKEVPESVNGASTSAESMDGKKKDNLINFSMYHCFESFVGKNRNSKPDVLKRTNSSNTIGTFTLQRYVSMKKALDFMREAKKKPQLDAAIMKQQQGKECSFNEDAAAANDDDKINLFS